MSLKFELIMLFCFGICEQDKLSLLSRSGVQQLQLLIFAVAFFHVCSSFLTFSLGMAKVIFYAKMYNLVRKDPKKVPKKCNYLALIM